MEDGEPHLLSIPEDICSKGLVPSWFVGLCLGGGALDRDLVDVDGHVGLHGHRRHLMARHEVGELEPLGLDHRDLQPAVEHLWCLGMVCAVSKIKTGRVLTTVD